MISAIKKYIKFFFHLEKSVLVTIDIRRIKRFLTMYEIFDGPFKD